MKKHGLGLVSKNRNTIYGLSILWIMLFHSTLVISSPWLWPLKQLKRYGNCGVDVFLLLSGISLYFSLERSKDLRAFYVKRFRRVWIPTLLVTIPWYLLKSIGSHRFSITHFLLDITGLSIFLEGNRTIWFVTVITICYVIYPAVYNLYKATNNSIAMLFMTLCVSLAFNYLLRSSLPVVWDNTEILFRRIPVFLIGAYTGKYVYENIGSLSTVQALLISSGCCFLFLLLSYENSSIDSLRYLYIILATGAVILISILGNIKRLSNAMTLLSPITLEIYLCHEKIIKVLNPFSSQLGNVLLNLIAFVLAIACAYVLSLVAKKVLSLVSD